LGRGGFYGDGGGNSQGVGAGQSESLRLGRNGDSLDGARRHREGHWGLDNGDLEGAVSSTNGAREREGDHVVELQVNDDLASGDVLLESTSNSGGDSLFPVPSAFVGSPLVRAGAASGEGHGSSDVRGSVNAAVKVHSTVGCSHFREQSGHGEGVSELGHQGGHDAGMSELRHESGHHGASSLGDERGHQRSGGGSGDKQRQLHLNK